MAHTLPNQNSAVDYYYPVDEADDDDNGASEAAQYTTMLERLLSKMNEFSLVLAASVQGGGSVQPRRGSRSALGGGGGAMTRLSGFISIVDLLLQKNEACAILRRQLEDVVDRAEHTDDLNERNKNVCSQCMSLRGVVTDLRCQVSTLRQRLEDAPSASASLTQDERSRFEERIAGLQSKLCERDGLVRQQQKQLTEMMDRVLRTAELESNLQEVESAGAYQRHTLEGSLQRRLSSLQEGRNLYRETRSAVESILASKDAHIATLTKTIAELQEKVSVLMREAASKDETRGRPSVSVMALSDATREVERLQTEIVEIEEQHQDEKEALVERISQLERTVNDLQVTIQMHQQHLSNKWMHGKTRITPR